MARTTDTPIEDENDARSSERGDAEQQDLLEAAPRGRLAPVVDNERIRTISYAVAGVLGFWFVIQLLWPVSLGALVNGAVLGGLTALIALAIALVYRANRIVNFAAADLGAVPAVFGVMLITALGFNYFLAIPIALASSLVVGALVEFLFVRRFFRSPRLILTVVTIGIAQVLGAAGAILPQAFDEDIPAQDYPSPFDWSFGIGNQIFTGNHVVAMLAVPAVIIGLVIFFRYTDVGIAVRASASSAERASLVGVPVKRMQMTVWMLATFLATLSMLLRAGIIGLPIGRVLGPSILLPALAAAVIGRMERFPTIVVAALGIGMVETAVFRSTGQAHLVSPILFAIILGALLVQRKGLAGRLQDSLTSTWRAIQEHRPIPTELRSLPEVRYTKLGLGGALAAFVLLAPAFMSNSSTIRLSAMMIFAMVGISLVILTGWAGEVSLGQVAFLGLGAAAAGGLTQHLGWDLSVALIAGGVVGAVAAVLIGLPALRIRGMFLAVTTLAFALATSDYFLAQRPFPNGFSGYLPSGLIQRPLLLDRISVSTEPRFYYLVLFGLVMSILAARGIRRSRTGRVLIALRENERAAEAFGISVTRAKLTAFALSGFVAAFAGGLFVHLQRSLGVNPFLPEESLKAFTMVVIGGLGSIPGAIAGATYIRGLEWFLPGWLPREIGFVAPLMGSGLGMILILMAFPGGLASAFYQFRDNMLRWVARRRGILVPSLVADMREEAFAQEGVVTEAAEAAAGAGAIAPDGAREAEPDGDGSPRARRRRAAADRERAKVGR